MKTASKPRASDLWYTQSGESHRVVAIEYQDGHPWSVVTEMHWDHTGKPWFNPAKDQPTGTSPETWDFDRCKRDQATYYHLSGSGGDIEFVVARFTHPSPPKALLWVARGVPIVTHVSHADGTWNYRRVSNGELLRRGYQRIARPKRLPLVNAYPYRKAKTTLNPFEAAWEGETVYGDRCQDDLPCEDTYEPCEHVRWCDECVMWFYCDDQTYVESSSGKHDCPDDEET